MNTIISAYSIFHSNQTDIYVGKTNSERRTEIRKGVIVRKRYRTEDDSLND